MSGSVVQGLVSVIIPAFNAGGFLSRSIESALAQRYAPVEVVVVDDGSTDDTRSVAAFYGDQIEYFYKNNGGPASARNMGIRHARGEYIAFLDADDYWLKNKLDLQVTYLQENPACGLVHANTFISEPNKELFPAFLKMRPPTGRIFEDLFKENSINNLTVLARRSCIENVQGFDENRNLIGIEDYELWLRIALRYDVGFLNQVVAVYNIHDQNISDEEKAIYGQLYILRKFIEKYPWIESKYPGLFQEKLERVSFRYACRLMQKSKYHQACHMFSISSKKDYLHKNSVVGIITSRLKTNVFYKNRVAALRHKHYGNYLLSKGRKAKAFQYFLKSLRLYPLQKTLYQSIIRLI